MTGNTGIAPEHITTPDSELGSGTDVKELQGREQFAGWW